MISWLLRDLVPARTLALVVLGLVALQFAGVDVLSMATSELSGWNLLDFGSWI